MAKRKKNIAISTIGTDIIFFYADDGLSADVERIEGVLSVEGPDPMQHSGLRLAWIDGRYDPKEIASEMEALNENSDIPSAFQ